MGEPGFKTRQSALHCPTKEREEGTGVGGKKEGGPPPRRWCIGIDSGGQSAERRGWGAFRVQGRSASKHHLRTGELGTSFEQRSDMGVSVLKRDPF